MPKPGKQPFNPIAAAKAAVSSATKQMAGFGATKPVSPLTGASGQLAKPECPGLKPRGISVLGTEERLPRLSMRRASALSVGLHVAGPVALALLGLVVMIVISLFMNFNFWDWFKPKTPQDMTFTLVDSSQAKRPDHPVFKGNANQQAGGKQHKEQPLNPAKETAARPKPQAAKPVAPQKHDEQPPRPTEQPRPQPVKASTVKPPASITKPVAIAKPAQKNQPEAAKPSEPAAKPQAQPAKTASPPEPMQVSTHSSDFGISTSPPDNASAGNPQDGPAKEAGVDTAQDVDYGPFMADLQKRISRNWTPPRGMESRKVVLMFYVKHDGQVVKVEIKKSSGDQEADRSAIEAVQVSGPFLALPPQIKEDILPVEFTFDYNVLNPKNAKKALKW